MPWLSYVNRNTIKADIIAGSTGAILVIPQGIAYALIAGLPPEFGLYTAIISATLAAFFGSSMHMISGPTAALSIVSAVVINNAFPHHTEHYIIMMVTLTFMVGVIQLTLGILKFGLFINFISHTVVQGFTAGAALIIAASQINNLLGLNITTERYFMSYLINSLSNIKETNFYSLCIAITTIATAFFLKKHIPKSPYLLISMIVGVLTCFIIEGSKHGVEMLGSLSGRLPETNTITFNIHDLTSLSLGAFSIALLGLVEASSISRGISIRSKQKINNNKEFIGQGISNLLGSFFSCYPSTGSFTRSGGNYDSGAKTPLASLFSALIVVFFMFMAPSVTTYIPNPVMAASIMVITWNLLNFKELKGVMILEKSEVITFISTFICTLLFSLEYSIYIGTTISIFFYLYKTSHPKITSVAPKQNKNGTRSIRSVTRNSLQECPEIKIIRIDGSLFFASSPHVQAHLQKITSMGYEKIIVISKGINFIDSSAQEMLSGEMERIKKSKGEIFFCSLKGTVYDSLENTGFKESLDNNQQFNSTSNAIRTMIHNIPSEKCSKCPKKVFLDCPK